MSLSVIELVREDIITALGGISIANGYRNDVAGIGKVIVDSGQVTSYPWLVVALGQSTIDSIDSAKTVFAEMQPITVFGYVAAAGLSTISSTNYLADAAESLIHDLKKCLTARVSTNIVSETLRSIINGEKALFRINRLYPDNRLKGDISIDFTVKVRYNQSSTF